MADVKPRQAVAAAIYCPQDPGQILLVQRPQEPGEELPGLWGLPAASLLPGEEDAVALARLGRLKLGADLAPLRLLARGRQERPGYVLYMRLYEALLSPTEPRLVVGSGGDVTLYTAWRWGEPPALRQGAAEGSLCCRLFLEYWAGCHPDTVQR